MPRHGLPPSVQSELHDSVVIQYAYEIQRAHDYPPTISENSHQYQSE